MKKKLPGKSVSIAAPASYWYLKQFPIDEIGDVVDYIVYMTYDLHGQWDFDSEWSTSGCPTGNCLRSHVNKTETLGALVSDQCRRTYLEQHPLPLSPSTVQILKISYTNSMRW